jgi:hypothetical protein
MNFMNALRSQRFRLTRPAFLWALCALVLEVEVEHHPGVPKLVALLPLIPALLFVVAVVRTVQKMDELQKRICLESVFIAFMLTLVLTFVLAGLSQAGIYHPEWDSVGTPMMFLWASAYIFSSWKYR